MNRFPYGDIINVMANNNKENTTKKKNTCKPHGCVLSFGFT